jgi:predicted transposase YdaD
MLMEQNIESSDGELPGWAQALIKRGMIEGRREGERNGERNGELRGKLEATRSTLQRQLKRAKIELTEEQRARIETCSDMTMLDRWTENVIGAKTAADVFGAE